MLSTAVRKKLQSTKDEVMMILAPLSWSLTSVKVQLSQTCCKHGPVPTHNKTLTAFPPDIQLTTVRAAVPC